MPDEMGTLRTDIEVANPADPLDREQLIDAGPAPAAAWSLQ
ncbi:MAG TPA: hypothetical protein VM099_10850 [Gemmatimonadaceae bacterium]|nr:hypothetical protein [Gemmatimonadaceae bacterium]